MMIISRMKAHLNLCKRNLKNKKVKCCLNCPFEDEIVKYDENMKVLFDEKRISFSSKNR